MIILILTSLILFIVVKVVYLSLYPCVSQLLEMRGLHPVVMPGDISPAEIIRQHHNYIWWLAGSSGDF